MAVSRCALRRRRLAGYPFSPQQGGQNGARGWGQRLYLSPAPGAVRTAWSLRRRRCLRPSSDRLGERRGLRPESRWKNFVSVLPGSCAAGDASPGRAGGSRSCQRRQRSSAGLRGAGLLRGCRGEAWSGRRSECGARPEQLSSCARRGEEGSAGLQRGFLFPLLLLVPLRSRKGSLETPS